MLSLSLGLAVVAAACQPAPRPNVVLIVTDDQGYGDLSCHGNPVLQTPNLDALAAQCPRVARFYVCPVCAPTRASLLTGRWHLRTRVVDTWRGRAMMDPDEVTLAEMLRGAGYRTGIFGKWHLGDCYPMRPTDQGFDEALVHRGGGLAQASDPVANDRRYTDPILFHDGEQVATHGYCTDVFFDAAIGFVDRAVADRRPFFAYIATNAPHDPFHDVPPRDYERYRDLDLGPALSGQDADVAARTFAMIANLDAAVGRLLRHLRERELERDTVVVFLCDNGPRRGRYNAGLRGGKGDVFEGGIRSPLFVRWPRHLGAGTEVAAPTAHVDLVPTLLEAAGVPPPAGIRLDGRSLLPLLAGRDVDWPARHLVIQAHRGDAPVPGHNFAVIGERWKLVRPSGFGREQPAADAAPAMLFDLLADPGERVDRAAGHEDTVADLQRVYEAWLRDVSSTRPDNYAPPRIVVGSAHEPHTWLTRQDWRIREPQAEDGEWLLAAEAARRYAVRVCFRQARRVTAVRLTIGGRRVEREVGAEGDEVDVGEVELPAGEFAFGVMCRDADAGGDWFGVYQVSLRARG